MFVFMNTDVLSINRYRVCVYCLVIQNISGFEVYIPVHGGGVFAENGLGMTALYSGQIQ